MLNQTSHSASQGVCRSLSQREWLRALSSWSATPQQSKQWKKEREMKSFEFVLMNINTESKNWSIAEENVALQGLFEVTTSSREAGIHQAIIGNATREKYSMISDHDLIKGSCWNQFLAKDLITNCRNFQEPLAGFETLVFLGKNLQWWNSNFWQPLWD